MNRGLYRRLAWQNIRKNKNTFLPFLFSGIMMVAMFYMLHSIWKQADDTLFYGATTMKKVLIIGVIVAGIFSVCVLFYTNSFLMKQRTRELGLYSLLGMEKKHIGKVVFWEMALVGIGCIGIGLGVGILFSRLMFLVLLKLLQINTSFVFHIMPESVLGTFILFAATFVAIILTNGIRVFCLKPIELMHGEHVGEREPKAKWLLALIGLAALGYGYYLALTTKNPLQAYNVFFLAVLCVIVGTYLLFLSGSIAIFKMLKKNKRYYYNKKHFITVSGMMYRMKRNAVGLANICILCTGVLVVLSSTVSLYVGIEDVLRNRYPKDVMTDYLYEKDMEDDMPEEWKNEHHYNYALVEEKLLERAKEYNVEIRDMEHYYEYGVMGSMQGTKFVVDNTWNLSVSDYMALEIISQEDYNALTGENITLDAGTVLLYCSEDKKISGDEITVGNQTWNIVGRLDKNVIEKAFDNAYGMIFMVVPSLQDLLELSSEIQGDFTDGTIMSPEYYINFNLEGDTEDKNAYCEGLRDVINDTGISHLASVDNIYTTRPEMFGIYGGLFFIGIFIGTLFLITTVMIIYYKQISEGYDDRERFGIMQKVGMSKAETKSVIRNQIVQVFFLPILLAIVHICFAFKIIKDVLVMLNFTNVTLFVTCTIGTILVFTLVYFIVYWLTARTYYRITSQASV